MNEIIQVISSLGFPVAMCIALCWYIKTTQAEYNKKYENMVQGYAKQIKEVTQALENNTKVMEEILQKVKVK